MIPELAHFELDPAYGAGAYRRRLAFTAIANAVVAQVDDSHHSYWLVLEHDPRRVTALEAGFNRAPTDMCRGAIAGLQALVGCALHTPASELMANLPRASNCTHLVDLALWAIAHVGRSAIWEIIVPDQTDQPVWIAIEREARTIHRWQVAGFDMVAPEELAGKPLMSGFMMWAGEKFSEESLIAATMLQRGVFVARGRRYVVDQGEPIPLASASGMAGMCWSYSGDRLLEGSGTRGYVRDFSISVDPAPLPVHLERRIKDFKS
jgi:hypothetical protein